MDVDSDMFGVEKSGFVESSYQVNDDVSIPVYANVQLYPCSNCGRCFNPESLRKHQPVCKKTSQKQRKIFDAGKQRAADSDVPYTATKETTQFYTEGVKPKQDYLKKRPTNWREGHESLVKTIREARQVTRAIETGAPLPKKTPAQVPSDYVQCEYCQRNFNKHSAERHIPFCETQHKRKQMQYTTATTGGGGGGAPSSANNTRAGTGSGSIGRNGRAYQQQQYGLESPVGSANKQHQISSAPSTYASRRPPKNNDEKDYRRPPINPNTFKKPNYGETATNGTPPKYGTYRVAKTRSATGVYPPGMMRTGRTMENDDLNVIAAGRGQQKADPSPQPQRRVVGMKTRSPSPARRPSQSNGVVQQYQQQQQQQQKTRTQIPAAAAAAKHCHECGDAFPVEWAKFCYNQGGIVTLPERQFNCPPCIQSKKSSCSIPSSVKPPCDGMKCFNCPPKYLCFDVNMCHFANDDDKVILKQESK
ncbi:unnamed protein product [Adineta steineri]|uniref:C2HC/C3H-type domain-containing protein n=1 Tax=Adineta steineri TaxID=433720 RepID=A0A815KWU2_9BILA|nr:unnamed protein product [Adineta steineri]CAF3767688.1 unnamed protein product [Adineta steineri]